MISFIVIGRNEGERLRNCLNSVYLVIKQFELNSEVIYVDSDSADNSIEVAQEFKDITIIKLHTKYNAATGRNIGAAFAKMKYLVFIDGDMELVPDFFQLIPRINKYGNFDFISGQLLNKYYDKNGNFLFSQKYYKIKSEIVHETTTGGLFLIKKSLWLKMNGMKNRYKYGEDLDFGLRMAKAKHFLKRYNQILAIHHTVEYFNIQRMWTDLLSGRASYSRGVLYRNHFFNKYIYKRIISSDPTVIILLASFSISLLFNPLILAFGYPISVVLIISVFKRHSNLVFLINRIVFQIVRDINTIGSFIFFYPKDFKPKYDIIKN